ncbi:MAG: hypothetical protein WBH63_01745 [Bacillota bacterium]
MTRVSQLVPSTVAPFSLLVASTASTVSRLIGSAFYTDDIAYVSNVSITSGK